MEHREGHMPVLSVSVLKEMERGGGGGGGEGGRGCKKEYARDIVLSINEM